MQAQHRLTQVDPRGSLRLLAVAVVVAFLAAAWIAISVVRSSTSVVHPPASSAVQGAATNSAPNDGCERIHSHNKTC
jgi:hypothetical protein